MVDVTEPPETGVIERRAGGGAVVAIGLILVVAIIVGAFYLTNRRPDAAVHADPVAGATDKPAARGAAQ
ncbi:hypothetical protein U1872_15095 [Sphingomonas sp. RB3P16]|uniref:hypothetical protein n=1 Tax=Parasphingomonas frigoris TaxID=3096163 RepID=UPI002FC5D4D9